MRPNELIGRFNFHATGQNLQVRLSRGFSARGPSSHESRKCVGLRRSFRKPFSPGQPLLLIREGAICGRQNLDGLDEAARRCWFPFWEPTNSLRRGPRIRGMPAGGQLSQEKNARQNEECGAQQPDCFEPAIISDGMHALESRRASPPRPPPRETGCCVQASTHDLGELRREYGLAGRCVAAVLATTRTIAAVDHPIRVCVAEAAPPNPSGHPLA
jgi:hypothetical protein